ncbi:hypothetical protein [Stratiformator vulcanicus]|uniref:hypothetical protein n=1 Tax=Stratiformator vulcanicus TaxID=2527980 RepID=UPI0011AA7646|nr:hypothetical protein [Stratiformator vulcanicus]
MPPAGGGATASRSPVGAEPGAVGEAAAPHTDPLPQAQNPVTGYPGAGEFERLRRAAPAIERIYNRLAQYRMLDGEIEKREAQLRQLQDEHAGLAQEMLADLDEIGL